MAEETDKFEPTIEIDFENKKVVFSKSVEVVKRDPVKAFHFKDFPGLIRILFEHQMPEAGKIQRMLSMAEALGLENVRLIDDKAGELKA